MNSKDIAKLIPGRRNKVYTYPGIVEVKGTVEVHGLVLRVINQDRSLHIGPLSDEIGKYL